MRLIDADKLLEKNRLVKAEAFADVIAIIDEIKSAPTVKAIPISEIEEWIEDVEMQVSEWRRK